MIHQTACIEPGALIHDTAAIGPYCSIGANVIIEENVVLHSHIYISGNTKIGAGTVIFPFASIGCIPQDLKYKGEDSKVIIGCNNTIREYVTISPGTAGGIMETTIGDNCLLMVGVHIGHDCVVGNNVIMANNATLAGHVVIGDHAVLGGLSAYHQFVRIGQHAMIGGGSMVDSDVIPYGAAVGNRAVLEGLNIRGMRKRHFNKNDIIIAQKAFEELFILRDNETMLSRLQYVKESYSDNNIVIGIVRFIEKYDKRPLCMPNINKQQSSGND